MKLVKIIGSVTSTIKDDTLKGFKLLMALLHVLPPNTGCARRLG